MLETYLFLTSTIGGSYPRPKGRELATAHLSRIVCNMRGISRRASVTDGGRLFAMPTPSPFCSVPFVSFPVPPFRECRQYALRQLVIFICERPAVVFRHVVVIESQVDRFANLESAFIHCWLPSLSCLRFRPCSRQSCRRPLSMYLP